MFKHLKQAQTRIKELVEGGNYPMKVYRKKHGRVNSHPLAWNSIRRVEQREGIPVKAFSIKEWEPPPLSYTKSEEGD